MVLTKPKTKGKGEELKPIKFAAQHSLLIRLFKDKKCLKVPQLKHFAGGMCALALLFKQ